MHGGKQRRGLTAGQFKTGRYSKYLPSRLLERYTESLSDSELLALRDEVAIVDSRLNDLLSRVDTGESGQMWSNAQSSLRAFLKADRGDDSAKRSLALMDLEDALATGLQDYSAWQEIQSLIEQRRKLAETERKRLVDMQQIITSEQAMVLVSGLIDAVRRNVDDRDTLAAIQDDITRLIGRAA